MKTVPLPVTLSELTKEECRLASKNPRTEAEQHRLLEIWKLQDTITGMDQPLKDS